LLVRGCGRHAAAAYCWRTRMRLCRLAIIAIISLLSEVDVRIFEQNKLNIRDGQHTEGIMLAKNPSDLIASFGH
jgi:hypothetical protein